MRPRSRARSVLRRRAPIGLLAELTHRCPLQCPYCSNPLELERVNTELTTAEWQEVMRQAAQLGILQIHLSGGEPTARRDLEEIVKTAAEAGLYTNLITAAVLLTRERLAEAQGAGLDHVQISIQDVDKRGRERRPHRRLQGRQRQEEGTSPAGCASSACRSRSTRRSTATTSSNVEAIIDYAVELGAGRVEIAHVQYYAWALKNRSALMPTREQFMDCGASIVEKARERLKGVIVIDFVVPDYYAKFPKPCMGGWGRGIINVTPSGRVLPCHAAESINAPRVRQRARQAAGRDLAQRAAFQKYRGTEWMKEPCRTCPRREIDYGGCRCQAFALTGDAANTDPACSLSPLHEEWAKVAEVESHQCAAGVHLPAPGWCNAEGRQRESAGSERRISAPQEIANPDWRTSRNERVRHLCSVQVHKRLGTFTIAIR